MIVEFNWPTDVVERLRREAQKKELSLDEYVLQIVLQSVDENGTPADDAERVASMKKPAEDKVPHRLDLPGLASDFCQIS